MSRIARLISIGIALSISCAANAADKGIYLGAGISESSVDVDLRSGATHIPINGSDTKFKIIAGIRPIDWFAVEVNYVDFGSFDSNAGGVHSEFNLKGVDAFAVGLFQVAIVDLYAKAGVVRWDQDANITNIRVASDTGYDFAYGAGVQVHFGSLGVRAEYERFNIENADANMVSVGVTWTFF
jgi:hypothetical protein